MKLEAQHLSGNFQYSEPIVIHTKGESGSDSFVCQISVGSSAF